MVCSYEVDRDEQGNEGYHLFTRALFGIDDALAKMVEYLQ
jgi:hypothetical protein